MVLAATGQATTRPSRRQPDAMAALPQSQDAPATPGAPLPEGWEDIDFSGCFWLAIADAKERVARGEPVPAWLCSLREPREGDGQ